MAGRVVGCGLVVLGLAGFACSPPPDVEESYVEVRRAVEAGTGAADSIFGLANEPAIAVNPTDPNNIVFAVGSGIFISHDGGATFPTVGGATIPPTHGGNRDSALAFDSVGRLYIGYLLPVTDAAGGGRDVFVQQINPQTGAIAGPASNVTAQVGMSPGNGHDKPWIAVDRFPGSPFRDRVYAVWDDGAAVIQTAYADSPGTAWTGVQALSAQTDCPNAAGRFCFPWPSHIAVAPDGGVYITYRTGVIVNGVGGGASVNFFNFVDDERIVLHRSDNGGVSYAFSTVPAAQPLTTNTGNLRLLDRSFSWTLGAGQDYVLPDPGNPQRLAIVFNRDPTASPNDGPGFDDVDVFITRSNDRGANWTTAQRVNADGVGPLQTFPTASWDSANDCIAVMWLDGRRGFADPAFRNNLGNVLLDVIIRMSADGGVTFGPEFQVNDNPLQPDPGEANFNAPGVRPANRIGEYNGVLSRRGVVWPQNTGQIGFDNSDHRCALPDACVLGSRSVDIRDRAVVTAPLMAGTRLEVGSVATLNGDAQVGNGALIRDRGVVNGNLTLGGTLAHQNIFTVNGTLIENDSPVILTLQQRTFATGAGTQEVANDAIVTLAPGNFGDMTFRARSQVTLPGGTYNFASLNIEPDVRVTVGTGGVSVNVQGTFQLGDRSVIIPSGGSLVVYSNGTLVRIGTDARFVGVLVAPNATVTVFSRTIVDGCVGGRDLTFDADSRLNAGSSRLPLAPAAAPTCSDGIRNGSETGVDCGGSCPVCPVGTLTAATTVTSDWGGGYCVTLRVTNTGTLPTTTWNLGVALNGSVIFTSWNGTFSGSAGNITVAPGFSWNQVIAPGATNDSVGFCANRPPGAGTASILSASGSF